MPGSDASRLASPFEPLLREGGPVVLDGGLATTLEEAGHRLDGALWSARLLRDEPFAIRHAHERFLEAGAECLTTCSYQATIRGFETAGIPRPEAEELLRRSVELALAACRRMGRSAVVAASIGPYGAYLADGSEYDGRYGLARAELVAFHRPRFEILADAGAGLLAFETIPSASEAEALLDLLSEAPAVPAWMSFTCADGVRLRDGSSFRDAARACAAHPQVVAVGVNCTHPDDVEGLVDSVADLQVARIAYPNSGEGWDGIQKVWKGTRARDSWLDAAERWVAAGAQLVGGCCRVGPEDIRALRQRLSTARRRSTHVER